MSTLDDLSDGTRVDKEPLDDSGSGTWPSKTNRQAHGSEALSTDNEVQPGDLPGGVGLRPLSVGSISLRDEAVAVHLDDGTVINADCPSGVAHERGGKCHARPVYRVVNEWRDWMQSPIYQSGHIEIESDDGEKAYIEPENRFQQSYAAKYYARLKTFERGVQRIFDDLTVVMLTLGATNENANGDRRCPAGQMREIEDGRKTARKQLYHILDGFEWVHCRMWEPHQSGYGHQHVAVFVDDPDDELEDSDFAPFMDSYVSNTPGAGSEAHDPSGDAVSVNHGVSDVGSYIAEYLGLYGDEALERPLSEQMFYATLWATKTRRLDFGNDAQSIRQTQYLRESTDTLPDDRGGEGQTGLNDWTETEWTANHLCTVHGQREGYREHRDPGGGGGVSATDTDARSSGLDPPKYVE
jgi:hypothetical protein